MTGSKPGQPRGKGRVARFAQGTGEHSVAQHQYRVVIDYCEPTYASRQGADPKVYHWTYLFDAYSPSQAEELARREFREAEKLSSVGWPRDIVKMTTTEV